MWSTSWSSRSLTPTHIIFVQGNQRVPLHVNALSNTTNLITRNERFGVFMGINVEPVRIGVASVRLPATPHSKRILHPTSDEDADVDLAFPFD